MRGPYSSLAGATGGAYGHAGLGGTRRDAGSPPSRAPPARGMPVGYGPNARTGSPPSTFLGHQNQVRCYGSAGVPFLRPYILTHPFTRSPTYPCTPYHSFPCPTHARTRWPAWKTYEGTESRQLNSPSAFYKNGCLTLK